MAMAWQAKRVPPGYKFEAIGGRRFVGVPTSSEAIREGSDPKPGGNGRILWNHHEAVANVVIFRVEIVRFPFRGNDHSVGDTRVLINDGAIDYTVASDADRNLLRSAVAAEFVIIGTHYHAIANSGAALN